jgi:hypothetical protein
MFAGGVSSSRPIKSQTEQFPTAQAVFKKLVDEIVSTKYEGWIHFDGPKKDSWVEVANEPDHLILIFCYPFKNDLNKTLFEADVSVPGGWRLKKFNHKRLGGLLGGSAMFSVPRDQTANLIMFIDNLFIKFYGCGQDYKVSGYATNT